MGGKTGVGEGERGARGGGSELGSVGRAGPASGRVGAQQVGRWARWSGGRAACFDRVAELGESLGVFGVVATAGLHGVNGVEDGGVVTPAETEADGLDDSQPRGTTG